MAEAMNCWEYKSCGRQPGGSHVHDLGECPAATFAKADGVNRGFHAGRVCWAVAGTLCGGEVQGTMASKLGNCLRCDFYKQVAETEPAFTFDLR